MQAREVESVLTKLTSEQWGLFTTRQAGERGVTRLNLARLEDDNRLERLAQGVYRLTSTPTTPYDELRAAWLATDPTRTAEERMDDTSVVIGSRTAAWLHGIGDFQPTPFVFHSPDRRQSRKTSIRFRQRALAAENVTIVHGLPTTTIEQTIADLVLDHEDDSHVADALRDTVNHGKTPNRDTMAVLLAPAAARRGHNAGDGAAVYDALAVVAGTDPAGQLRTLARKTPINSILSKAIRDAVAINLEDFTLPAAFTADMRNMFASEAFKNLRPDVSHLSDMARAIDMKAFTDIQPFIREATRISIPKGAFAALPRPSESLIRIANDAAKIVTGQDTDE